MGTLNDVVINKLSGGLGRRNPSQDMVSGLLFDGVVTEKFEQDELYRLASLDDAEALGIDASYDSNGQSAYYQIQQYFRMNPSGDLFIMGTTGNSYAEIVGKAKEMQVAAEGDIRQMAVIYSGTTEFDNASATLRALKASAVTGFSNLVIATGDAGAQLDEDFFLAYETAEATAGAEDPAGPATTLYNSVKAEVSVETIKTTENAILTAQTQAGEAYALYMPFEVLLEGKGFTVDDIDTMPNLDESGAENVSVVVAMDPEKAKLDGTNTEGSVDLTLPNYSNTAAVGVALGAVSRAKVSENIAWVEKFNLAGEGFAKAGFVGAKKLATAGNAETLNSKRYVFAKKHVGFPGVYFNDSHTATAGTSDFAYVENNRTINKATRLLRSALVTKIASPVLIDSNGRLPQVVTKDFETLCRVALEGMVSNEEVSQFDVYVDPKQNILATSELRIKAEIIPIGTARKIMVDLGFKNPFGIDKA